MFFLDGEGGGGSSQGVDTSAQGFLNIFGSDAGSQTDSSNDSDSQSDATGADGFSQEGSDDGQDLSPEDLVTARFAASLEADGIELPADEDEDEVSDPDGIDLSQLSPEELRNLAEEALSLKQQTAQAEEQQVQDYVRSKVYEAEQAARSGIDQRFRQEVLTKSESHYQQELMNRVAAVIQASHSQNNPDAYILENSIKAARTVVAYQQQWEAKQAANWSEAANAAAEAARRNVPELRQYYAITLAREFNLPEQAIGDIAHHRRDIEHFRSRAEELANIASFAGQERARSANAKRQVANDQLREQPVRTSSTGRPRGGKAPAYKGTAAEGMAILRTFHSN